jgi:hypothetical protein
MPMNSVGVLDSTHPLLQENWYAYAVCFSCCFCLHR